jgi:hypothetical protein
MEDKQTLSPPYPVEIEMPVIPPVDEPQPNSQAEEALKMLMSLMNQQVRLNYNHSRQKSTVSILSATSTQTIKGIRIPTAIGRLNIIF